MEKVQQAQRWHHMEIAGLPRRLPLCAVGEDLWIAAFIMLGDVEVTVASATRLLSIAPEFDVLFTAEAKGIPLCYEMARQSGKPYAVSRKGKKLYMPEAYSIDVTSITTAARQTHWLGLDDAAVLQGRRVLLVDDVISTGESLTALEKLTARAGGIVAGKMAVLAEGDARKRKDIIYLEGLPLFDGAGNIQDGE